MKIDFSVNPGQMVYLSSIRFHCIENMHDLSRCPNAGTMIDRYISHMRNKYSYAVNVRHKIDSLNIEAWYFIGVSSFCADTSSDAQRAKRVAFFDPGVFRVFETEDEMIDFKRDTYRFIPDGGTLK